MDQPNQWSLNVNSQPDSTFNHGGQEDVQLSDFMARPILIYSYDWTVGSAPDFVIDPWTLFFSNKRIINRINNYNLLRCTLNVKIQISGTIFHYGRIMVSYFPLPLEDSLTRTTIGLPADLVHLSQRPHIFLDPTLSQGGDMRLPFFYYNNWLSIPSGDWGKMGNLTFNTFAALRHANNGDTPVTIKVFAYTTDISLSIPTSASASGLISQSSDEYGKGIISKTATAVAKAMHELIDIPYIAPYARATTMLMSSTASIASTLGFSRPVILDDIKPVRQLNFGNLANCDSHEMVYKNSIDSKQELTVDPRTVGLDGKDQMSLNHINSVSSFFNTFSWDINDTPETLLVNMRVTPTTFVQYATEYHMTSVCFASRPFKYWTGTLSYRFIVVASSFHKGRIKIVYEPYVNPLSTCEYNTAYTKIVDIAEERDFCVDVGWGQTQTYLPIGTMENTNPFNPTRYTVPDPNSNGILSIYVVNQLVAPTDDITPISILTFISGKDDLSYAVPINTELSRLTYLNEVSVPPENYTPQSKEIPSDTDSKPDCALTTMSISDTLHDDKSRVVFIGEELISLRTLLRRYNLLKVSPLSLSTLATDISISYLDTIFPNFPGYSANGILQNDSKRANLVHNTLLTYMAPAYLGYRGALRYKHKPWTKSSNIDDYSYIETTEDTNRDSYITAFPSVYPDASTTLDYSVYASSILASTTSGLNGRIITSKNPGPALESEFVHYDNFRFRSTRDPYRKRTGEISAWDKCYNFCTNVRSSSTLNPLQIYISTGEDFSLFWYIGPPRVFYWDPAVIA